MRRSDKNSYQRHYVVVHGRKHNSGWSTIILLFARCLAKKKNYDIKLIDYKSASSIQGRSQKKIEGGPNFATFKSDVIYL